MRSFLFTLSLIALASCGPTATPAPETTAPETTAPETADNAETGFSGPFHAASPAAQSYGDLMIEPGRLVLTGAGVALATTTLDASAALPAITQALHANAAANEVELRHIDSIDAPASAHICGSQTPSHVAVVRQASGVTLLLFSGADAPGASARSSPCASLVYGAG